MKQTVRRLFAALVFCYLLGLVFGAVFHAQTAALIANAIGIVVFCGVMSHVITRRMQ